MCGLGLSLAGTLHTKNQYNDDRSCGRPGFAPWSLHALPRPPPSGVSGGGWKGRCGGRSRLWSARGTVRGPGTPIRVLVTCPCPEDSLDRSDPSPRHVLLCSRDTEAAPPTALLAGPVDPEKPSLRLAEGRASARLRQAAGSGRWRQSNPLFWAAARAEPADGTSECWPHGRRRSCRGVPIYCLREIGRPHTD